MGTVNLNDVNSVLKGYNMLLYFAGSMIMYEPDEECVIDFWSNGILRSLPVKSSNPRFMEAASQLRESCKDKTTCRENLQNDFQRLFSAGILSLAPPVESFYAGNSLPDFSHREKVSDFYESYGWKRKTRLKIPDDSLGIELLFLTLLVDKYISFEDDVCRNEMRKEIRRFINNHILSWLSEWNQLMQENARTLCYKGISTLVFACCEDIFDLMDQNSNEGETQNYLRN
jgi:TorA maturation chaperone TorD